MIGATLALVSVAVAIRLRSFCGLLAGLASGTMHMSWAAGFFRQWLTKSPYHDRQIVVLRPEDWPHWIHLSKPEAELLKALPAGSLEVETVRRPEKEKRAKGKRTVASDLFES